MMGYDQGEIILPSDPKACVNYNGLNYCGPDMQPISLANVLCHGNESSLADCNYELATDSCNHENVPLSHRI